MAQRGSGFIKASDHQKLILNALSKACVAYYLCAFSVHNRLSLCFLGDFVDFCNMVRNSVVLNYFHNGPDI